MAQANEQGANALELGCVLPSVVVWCGASVKWAAVRGGQQNTYPTSLDLVSNSMHETNAV